MIYVHHFKLKQKTRLLKRSYADRIVIRLSSIKKDLFKDSHELDFIILNYGNS